MKSTAPPSWSYTRLKRHASMKGRLGWQGLKSDEYLDEGPHVVSSAHFSGYRIRWEDCPRVSRERYQRDANIQLRHGDVLLMKDGAALGKLAQVRQLPGPACVNSHLLLLRPLIPSHSRRFLFYLLDSKVFQEYMQVNGKGSTFLGVSQESIGNFPFASPPASIQNAIANFLDRKTVAIDALIEKKQKLLDLLAEKRAVLINQAVTKGLDPNVPMKDSGIPWIGEIPAHWEVKRLKYVSSFVTSGPRGWGQYYSDSGPLFLRITNVARDNIDLLLGEDKQQCVAPPPGAEGVRTLALEGDVLITITADLGSVGVVPQGLGEAYISQHVALCRPNGGLQPRLVGYMVQGPWGSVHYDLAMNGGTKVGLTLDDVRNTPIAVPPTDQQAELVWRLDTSVGNFDATAKRLGAQLTCLEEYRQALITAAVTGQLDIDAEAPE